MHIKVAKDGYISGTYKSGVGTSHEEEYPLYGAYDICGRALGWAVSYQAYDSTAAWSGQAFEQKGETCIHTTWLLTEKTEYDEIWQSTKIGEDVFIPYEGKSKHSKVGVLSQPNIPKKLLDKQKKA